MRRFLLIVVLASLLLLVILVGLGFYLSPQDQLKQVEAIVVVSGGDTKRRTEEGIKLWREAWAPRLIFAGAAKEGVSNAQVMKRLALAAGVPEEAILIEEQSQNTTENARLVALLLRRERISSIILITSPYHQRRAYTAFRRELGKNFLILNHSALDEEWRKRNWWRDKEAFYLTVAEIGKIITSGLIKE